MYDDWVTANTTSKDLELLGLPWVYDRVTEPLVNLIGLKNLMIYWPALHPLETKAERLVMGDEYDAYQHGKIVLKDRAPGMPRGKNFTDKHLGYMGTYG